MKKLFLLLFIVPLFIVGCDNNSSDYVTYEVNEPVFMPAAEFRNLIKVTTNVHELADYGKMCFYKGYLYISEPGKGVHIVDNTNPANPKITGYIEILGNYDLIVRNNVLYADALIDLVWFDVSNPSSPVLKGRLEGAFPQALPIICNEFGYDYGLVHSSVQTGIIVDWKLAQRKERIESYDHDLIAENVHFGNSSSGGSNGAVGSMSRFGLYQDYLYTVVNNQMSVFNLTSATPEKAIDDIPIGGDVETIFSYKDKMFMGTPTGMMIYSVEDPLNPTYCSFVWHITGCDPVVVEDDLAYVTIHSGNFCGANNNELFIVDVSDVYHPRQLVSYTMTNPKGLGIDNGVLFLCDEGLKVFKVEDPQTLMSSKLAHYEGMDGFDVIPFNNILMMIADNGLYQYDYSEIDNIKEISVLPIKK